MLVVAVLAVMVRLAAEVAVVVEQHRQVFQTQAPQQLQVEMLLLHLQLILLLPIQKAQGQGILLVMVERLF
jgi:hypothetical protein